MLGIYTDLANEAYHAADGISKSGLDQIHRSPWEYRFRKDNPDLFKETPAMRLGTLIHTAVLEPHLMEQQYAVMPESIKQKRGKEYEAFKEEAGDREILTREAFDDARLIVDAVLENPVAVSIIQSSAAHGSIESSVFAEDFETGSLCKCRPDLITEGGFRYDLKTSESADGRSFSYQCARMRYYVQGAFYNDVCDWAGIDIGDDQFGFVVVEKSSRPYQCCVFHRLDDGSMERGRREYRDDLLVYARCMERGEWPGIPESYDVLTTSGYAYDEGVS